MERSSRFAAVEETFRRRLAVDNCRGMSVASVSMPRGNARVAADLVAWARLLGIHDKQDQRDADPGTHRCGSWPAGAVRLARHACKRIPKIGPDWPWKDAFLACWHRLCALPAFTSPARTGHPHISDQELRRNGPWPTSHLALIAPRNRRRVRGRALKPASSIGSNTPATNYEDQVCTTEMMKAAVCSTLEYVS